MLWKWIRSSSLPAGIIMMIHKKSMLHLVGMLFLCMWDLETLDFRLLTLLTSDLRCLTSFSLLVSQSLSLSVSHRNILESSSSVIFPIQLSPTETVMSARDFFFWMISLIFSSKVFLVMKRWTRTLFFWPMR